MPTDAKIGLLLPTSFKAAPPNIEEYTRFFRQADGLGFHSLWAIDRIFHRINIMEPLTLLTCNRRRLSVRHHTTSLAATVARPLEMLPHPQRLERHQR